MNEDTIIMCIKIHQMKFKILLCIKITNQNEMNKILFYSKYIK
jgi:hypothetical protein